MDITTDFGFKKLFSDPEVMKKFLNLLIREDDKSMEEDCKTLLEYWGYIMANEATMTKEFPFKDMDPIFERMEQICLLSNMTPEEDWEYWNELDNYLCTINALDTKYEEGEDNQLLKNVKSLLKKGYSIDSICDLLDIPQEKMKRIERLI